MGRIHLLGRLTTGVFSVLMVCSPLMADSTVQERLAGWREYLIKTGKACSVRCYNPDGMALVEMGPNCLPDLMETCRQEKDPGVLKFVNELVYTMSRFSPFWYSEEPTTRPGRDYQRKHNEDIPFLSMRVDSSLTKVVPYPAYVLAERDKLVEWWDRRKSFSKQCSVEEIRALTGRSREEFHNYDKAKHREWQKRIWVYGIYSIPACIDAVSEDDNPIAFCDFLRVAHPRAYGELSKTHDNPAIATLVSDKYPSKQSKIKVICEWWDEFGKTYTNLEDLYSPINNRVNKLRTELLETQPATQPDAR